MKTQSIKAYEIAKASETQSKPTLPKAPWEK